MRQSAIYSKLKKREGYDIPLAAVRRQESSAKSKELDRRSREGEREGGGVEKVTTRSGIPKQNLYSLTYLDEFALWGEVHAVVQKLRPVVADKLVTKRANLAVHNETLKIKMSETQDRPWQVLAYNVGDCVAC